MSRRFFSPCITLAGLSMVLVQTHAQTNVGTIFGHVADTTGGSVGGVSLTLVDPATNETTHTLTDSQGDYVFNSVKPATYRISAAYTGFSTVVRESVVLEVAEKIRVDFTLQPGKLTQQVEVTASSPLLQPGSSDLGTVINSPTMEGLPLEGRNVYELVTLVPGATPQPNYGYLSNGQNNLSGGPGIGLNQISISGGRNLTNEFLLDDVPDTTMGFNGVAIIPPLDSVQEFNVITNAPSAKFGRTGGGLTTAVTKSGTNDFHGDLWEFLRNDKLDANNFFANASGAKLPPFRQNQFGGTVGGPVIRNHTFFFGSYEGLRQAAGGQVLLTVPTDLQRKGDFSQTFSQSGSLIQIFNPFTTTQNPTTGAFSRMQFPNNVIPASLFDPVARNLLQYFPEPNLPGDPTTHDNNYLSQAGFHNTTNFYLGRIDHDITQNQRIFARLTYDDQNYSGSNVLGNIADFNFIPFTNIHKGISLAYTNVLNPTTVLDVRYGLLREEQSNRSPSQGFNISTLGFPAALKNEFELPVFPRFDIAGYTSLGTQYFTITDRDNTTNSLAASLSKVIGRHSIETGVDLRVIQGALFQASWPDGQFQFSQSFTNGPDPNGGFSNGNAFASFLLGTYANGFAAYDPHWFFSQHYYAFYVQDDIKVSQKLTVNTGLRWDYESPLADRYNQLSFVDLNATVPLQGVTPADVGFGLGLRPQPPYKGAVGFPGLNGLGKGVTQPRYGDWGPRLGFAYSINDKTVIRSGAAVLYPGTTADNSGNYPTVQGFNPITNPVDTANGFTPFNNPGRAGLLSNPFPNGLNPVVGASLGPLTSVGNSNTGFLRNDKQPSVQQWNFGVQRELPQNLLIEAAYVGSHGTHLEDFSGAQYNVLPDRYLSLGNALFDSLPNPFYGVAPVTSTVGASNTITREQLLLPYPYFTTVVGQAGHIATSNYNALQTKAQKRMSKGLSFLVSYTFSKSMDNASTTDSTSGLGHQDFNNRRLDDSVSAFDRTHIVNLSYSFVILLLGLVSAKGENAKAPLGDGLEQLRQARFDLAADAFRRALQLDPKLIIAKYDLGVCYFAQGQFGDARKAFEQTIELSPENRFAAYYLARIDLIQDRSSEAIRRFEVLVRRGPLADEFYYLGSAYFRESNVAAAIRSLKQAAEANPNDSRVHYLLARVYRRAGNNTEAEREFRHSAELRADSQKDAHQINVCDSALRSLSERAAVEECRRALDGTDPIKLVALGVLLARKGALEAALQPLSRATHLDPDDYDTHFNLGLVYMHMKRYEQARQSLNAAVWLQPESFEAVTLLGSALFALGEDVAALAQLRHAHELQPANEKVIGLLSSELRIVGQHAVAQGDLRQAATLLESAYALAPGSADIQTIAFQLATDCFARADYETTIRALKIAKESMLGSAEFHAMLGYSMYRTGDAAGAVTELQRAMDLNPGNQDYVLELSEVFVANNNPEAARTLLETANHVFPSSARIWFALGVSYIAAEDVEAGEAALKRSLELDTQLHLAYVVLGQAYRDAGRWDALLTTSEKLINADPTNHLGYFYKAFALIRQTDSDPAQIQRLLERSSALDANDPEPHYELAKLHARKGEKEAAVQELEKIVAVNAEFGQAYYQLYRLYAERGDSEKSGEAEQIYRRLQRERGRAVRKLLVEVRAR